MKHKILSAVVLATAALGAQMASAADGTINFSGKITSATCTATSNKGAPVVLPTVSAKSFGAQGNTAGLTAFTIDLTGCDTPTGNVHAYFNPGATVNLATGNLINATGSATGVELNLLNQNSSKIVLGAPDATQNSAAVTLTGPNATLTYFAQYVRPTATPVAAGSVVSSVMYDIVYQ